LDIPLVPLSDVITRHRLAAEGRACLLVVPIGGEPPDDWDDLEDWVRLPLDDMEVTHRRVVLFRRSCESVHSQQFT
jgi:hypothetical protein